MIFLLLKDEKVIDEIVIDKEYVGKEPVIKNYLINFLRETRQIDKKSIHFKEITKNSKAHHIALETYKNKKANIKISSDIVIKYLSK